MPSVGKVPEQLDHLLLGTNDRDRGIAWFEERTGVRAAVGGSHPGRGTRNALVALGGRRYLEIIAPDPNQDAANLQLNLGALSEPRLIAWAATADLDALAQRLRDDGDARAVPREGSRSRPDGRLLRWRTLSIDADLADPEINPLPFFIEWVAGSLHPSQDAPTGCNLASLEFEHPSPKRLESKLAALGIEAIVRDAAVVGLLAALDTPKGRVVLT